jgi:GNAT superfamily N-acetyltransferase
MSPEAVKKYGKRVSALVGSTITIVACDPVNDDVVYGFACGESGRYIGVESPTLHYVWVRKPFRRRGIGTALVRKLFSNEEPLIYTHITKAIHYANLERKWNLVSYDPYYIEGALYSKARNFDCGAVYGSGGGGGSSILGVSD